MAKITVIGASGHIGRRIFEEALRRQHEVTALVRDPERLKSRPPQLNVITGDVLDSGSVAGICKGQDVVVSAVGAGHHNPDYTLYRRAAESLATALLMLGSEAPRLIVVGGAGTLKLADGSRVVDSPSYPQAFRSEALGQAAALDYYRTFNDLKWTYLSPPRDIEPGARSGNYRIGRDQPVIGADGQSMISMEDFAVALIDEAENARFVNRQFTVGY